MGKFGSSWLERIRNIFRELDPSGEGQVSLGEFRIFELLWNEIQLCIREFIEFCTRMHGRDLRVTWDKLDTNGDGWVDKIEWHQMLKHIGFFGATNPMFNYLDNKDQGKISWEDFSRLSELQDPRMRSERHTS